MLDSINLIASIVSIVSLIGLFFKKKKIIKNNAVAVSSFSLILVLAIYLWFSRERIEPSKELINNVVTEMIDPDVKIVYPRSNEVKSTGYVVVYWEPYFPQAVSIYRRNSQILKTTYPVLPGSKIFINKPGELEIKLWPRNGRPKDSVKILIIGSDVSRFTLIVAMTILLIYFLTDIFRNFRKRKDENATRKSFSQ